MTWRRWFEAFSTETLPIIPVGATLKLGSKVRQEHVGKVPGTKNPDGSWSGLGGSWSDDHSTTMAQAKRYDKDGAAIAVQSRELLGLDIDVDEPELAAAIQSLAEDYLGLAPVRTRPGSARRLMMYRVDGAPLRKVRQEFGDHQAVELLAKGQEYVVEGKHPAGGEYAWLGEHPCDLGRDNLPEIDADLVARFFNNLRSMLSARGLTLGRAPTDVSAGSGTRRSLDDASLWAPSPEAVLELLKGWTPDELAHADFVAAMAAIKAALGPRRQEFYGDVFAWAPGARSTEDEATAKVWDSITDAQVGWDWLVAVSGDPAQVQADFDDPPPAPPAQFNTLESMLSRYVWAETQERFYDLETGLPLTPTNFNSRNVAVAQFGRSGVQSAVSVFQNEPRAVKVLTATYRPGGDRLVTETVNGSKRSAVNLWRPSHMKPADGPVSDEDVAPWLNHVNMLFGEPGAAPREHILNYMAFILQNPGTKINHAPVILGNTEGLGKDTVFIPFLAALGQHNFTPILPDDLLAPFNPYVEKQLIIVNEMANFHKREMTNKIKPLLASPPQYLLVNQKNVKQYSVPNLCNVIMFTNYDNAINIDEQDRRYWVWHCLTDDEGKQPEAYFDAIYKGFFGGCEEDDYSGRGSQLVARWLLSRDVSSFNPKERPAMTEAKQVMIDGGMPQSVRWLLDQFKPGEPFAGRTIVAGFELMDLAKQSYNYPATPCRDQHAATALRRAGFKSTPDKYRLDCGKVVRLWSTEPLRNNAAEVVKAYNADVKAGAARTRA
jgi:Family of unknown function (DUF5906)